jgi:alanine dehydrogenase
MIVGVPKEIKEQEYRVALLPPGAYQLAAHGHEILVERGAGVGAGCSDASVDRLVGAVLVPGARAQAYPARHASPHATWQRAGGHRINVLRGQITHPAVAEAHGMAAVNPESLLAE